MKLNKLFFKLGKYIQNVHNIQKKEKSRGMEMNVLSLGAMEQAATPKVMCVCC